MLVLHSSSSCDICLSDYWLDPSGHEEGKQPHSIKCGHVFCRQCLYANSRDGRCPLCRRPYSTSDITKLVVDLTRTESNGNASAFVSRGHTTNDTTDNEEAELLERLVTAWRRPRDQVECLVDRVMSWLQGRSINSHIPLRNALDLLLKAYELRRTVRHMNGEIKKLLDERNDMEDELSRVQSASARHEPQVVQGQYTEMMVFSPRNGQFQVMQRMEMQGASRTPPNTDLPPVMPGFGHSPIPWTSPNFYVHHP